MAENMATGAAGTGKAAAAAKAGAGLILLTLAAGQFLMTLDSSVMNVSMATVAEDLGTTITGIQTAITLYTLVMAALMITGGKIGSIIGPQPRLRDRLRDLRRRLADHRARAEPDRAARRLVVPRGVGAALICRRSSRSSPPTSRPPNGPAPTGWSPRRRPSRWRSARSSAGSSPPTSPGATSSPARSSSCVIAILILDAPHGRRAEGAAARSTWSARALSRSGWR